MSEKCEFPPDQMDNNSIKKVEAIKQEAKTITMKQLRENEELQKLFSFRLS